MSRAQRKEIKDSIKAVERELYQLGVENLMLNLSKATEENESEKARIQAELDPINEAIVRCTREKDRLETELERVEMEMQNKKKAKRDDEVKIKEEELSE